MRFAWCLFARKNYSCKNTSKTAAWLEAAPWRRDPTYLDALRVPPNVHLLAYGMSHVAQVAIAIACENADALVGPNGTRRTFDKDDPSRPIETWHLADRNASVTLLINRERYQEAGSGTAANLTRLLADRRFTHVAFNEPHPTCFFVRRREPKSRKRPCIDRAGTVGRLFVGARGSRRRRAGSSEGLRRRARSQRRRGCLVDIPRPGGHGDAADASWIFRDRVAAARIVGGPNSSATADRGGADASKVFDPVQASTTRANTPTTRSATTRAS